MPQIIKSLANMQSLARQYKHKKSIAFVPTMGCLHAGHLSLVEAACAAGKIVVVSIFVNPTQFGPQEDYASYPRNLEADLALLAPYDVTAVFVPDAIDMYPPNACTAINIKGIGSRLCGASRCGHFSGVATVVAKLVNLVLPDYMYMGAKDYQQIAVLKAMFNDLNFDCQIVACPIIRETDGLAMSSRNKYLSKAERIAATCLYQALTKAKELALSGEQQVAQLEMQMSDYITKHGGVIDYVEICDATSLKPQISIDSTSHAFLAVCFGKTRLIDNMHLSE